MADVVVAAEAVGQRGSSHTREATARAHLRRLRAWCATAAGRRLLALLAVALIVRLAIAPFHGFFHDLDIYVSWGLGVRRHLATAYSAGTLGYMLSNYPPLMMDVLAVWVGLYSLLAHLAGLHPAYDVYQSAIFATYMKLPALAADLATGCVVYALARRVRGEAVALIAASAYLFAPAILFDGALWGQTDSLMTLGLLLALLCAWRRRPGVAGALFVATVLLKPQPAVVGVVLLVYLWRWQGGRATCRFLVSGAGVGLVITLPYLLPPHPQIFAFMANLGEWARTTAHASNDAYNLWWLLGPRMNFAMPYLGPLSPTAVGWLLLTPMLLLAVAGVWRSATPQRLFLGSGLAVLAFFDVTTLQHERYLYPALALFLLTALFERRAAVFYAVASITVFCNMVLMVALEAPAGDFGSAAMGWSAFGRGSVLLTLIVAEVNLGLLVYVAVTYALAMFRSGQAESVAPEKYGVSNIRRRRARRG